MKKKKQHFIDRLLELYYCRSTRILLSLSFPEPMYLFSFNFVVVATRSKLHMIFTPFCLGPSLTWWFAMIEVFWHALHIQQNRQQNQWQWQYVGYYHWCVHAYCSNLAVGRSVFDYFFSSVDCWIKWVPLHDRFVNNRIRSFQNFVFASTSFLTSWLFWMHIQNKTAKQMIKWWIHSWWTREIHAHIIHLRSWTWHSVSIIRYSILVCTASYFL